MILTQRLLLRRFLESDRDPFADMNADRRVMEFFLSPLARAQSDEMIDRIESYFDRDGYGLWALEVRTSGEFIGFTGLAHTTFVAHFTPAVEIGWRLAHGAWGQGYASEAARAVLDFAFDELALREVVAFTSTLNLCSRSLMERLSMTHDASDDFAHPNLPSEHRLSPHVLYRLAAPSA
ncbi:MAG TPA: GNAT family N-acetyltransferase [Acidimicrobiales bacterium]|nr:GNAT family N-acetyltransferase [Acidimicrobiales bacterium]